MEKTIKGIVMLLELGCITGLAAIGLKRNNDAYKAGVKCAELEQLLCVKDLHIALKDIEIKVLKRELDKLKEDQQQETEES